MFDQIEPLAFGAVIFALVLGGVLKGATGAGAPVIAVPVIAAVYDVRLAVIIMATPNLLTNIWQTWQYRSRGIGSRFTSRLAIAGAAGTIIGTVVLVEVSVDVLQIMTAAIVLAYVVLRVIRPDFRLLLATAQKIVVPVGFAAGVLQGTAGISAPISISFLSAMRMTRIEFIATIAVFFASMSAVQVAVLAIYDLMTWHLLGLGAFAVIPLLAGMPLGAFVASRVGPRAFDRIILVFLALLACRLVWDALH